MCADDDNDDDEGDAAAEKTWQWRQ